MVNIKRSVVLGLILLAVAPNCFGGYSQKFMQLFKRPRFRSVEQLLYAEQNPGYLTSPPRFEAFRKYFEEKGDEYRNAFDKARKGYEELEKGRRMQLVNGRR